MNGNKPQDNDPSMKQAQIRNRRQQLTSAPQLLSVPEDEPVRSVLQILAENDILAVPVYRIPPTNKGDEQEMNGKEFLGEFALSPFTTLWHGPCSKSFSTRWESANDESQTADFERWIQIEEEMASKTIIGYTLESAVSWTLHSSDPMSSLVQMLLKFHRILIIDDDAIVASVLAENPNPIPGSSIVMVTQTDLIAWLLDNRDTLAPHSSTTILSTPIYEICERVQKIQRRDDPNQLLRPSDTEASPERHISMADGLHPRQHAHKLGMLQNVVTVPVTFTAIAAFRVMYMHRVTAVAVVEEHGGLVANLSASDLRGITADKESLGALLLPVFEFLETRTHRNPEQIKADQIRVVKPSDTLSMAVGSMVKSKIHRVWVQNSNDRPIGVVTMTDAISAFIPAAEVATDI
ncbi:hypothetical protein BC829DRAFT_444464 [Chytridium lagenaria]|nr:hypothetical protein BC829DRAFT_444464 [Chytridium lagenaria]